MIYLCALALLGDDVMCRGAALDSAGVQRIRGKRTLSAFFDSVGSVYSGGINYLEFIAGPVPRVGRLARAACRFSPLCDDWKRIPALMSPASVGRKAFSALLSLQSRQEFVHYWSIRRYPIAILISIEDNAEMDQDCIPDTIGGMVEMLGGLPAHEFVGFADLHPLLAADEVLGGQSDDCQRMDTYFDRPHLVTFGKRSTLSAYAKAMNKAAPDLGVSYTEIGDAGLVAFRGWPMAEVPPSKWHWRES